MLKKGYLLVKTIQILTSHVWINTSHLYVEFLQQTDFSEKSMDWMKSVNK